MTDYEKKYDHDFGKEARRLAEIWEKEKAGEQVMVTKQFTMTKSEYLKLPLYKQNDLYQQFPKEVKALFADK